jgi:nucleoside-diphosphate-sugar epimerase
VKSLVFLVVKLKYKYMLLVTGGSGLVGSHLISFLLKEGKKVRAMYHTNHPDITHQNLAWFKGDILDVLDVEEAMEGITHVYHCAAIVSFNPKDKALLYKTNVEGTANIVNASLDAGIEKLVYVSSVAALGRAREDKPIDESMTWSEATGNSVYGKTKYLAEMEVWRGIGEGLNAVIINPTIILGAADWNKGSAGIFKSVYNEFPWFTNGISGFVDVADVVKAMTLLMDSNITSERFIINGENVGYKDLFTTIASAFGKKPPTKQVTKTIAEIVWRVEAIKGLITGKKPLLTKETAHTAQLKVRFDNSKLLKALPSFSYTLIAISIKKICVEIKEIYNV